MRKIRVGFKVILENFRENIQLNANLAEISENFKFRGDFESFSS